MFLRKFTSEGLGHFSYMVGSKKQAVVIDPRRDVECYIETAREEGVNISCIFETHRNEDYVIGSLELADRTGAAIYHGNALAFGYGYSAQEGDTFDLGDLKLKVLETPGHTFESISLVLYDKNFNSNPVAVFTGDVLFVGDVGRTDFFPDRSEEVAGLLYQSIHEKLLPLGDGVILLPAHGAGSVCGASMAERDFSTLGIERQTNSLLQKNYGDFVNFKIHEHHEKPPYFTKMEELNLLGAAVIHNIPLIQR